MKYKEIAGLFPVTWNEVFAVWFEIRVEGLKEQESEQDQTCPNAALLLGRILFALEERLEYVLSELQSGADTGIVPSTGAMLVGIAEEDETILSATLTELQQQLADEYDGSHQGIRISMRKEEAQVLPALHPVSLQKMVFYLIQLPNGVQKMSGVIPGQADMVCYLKKLNLDPDGLHCRIRVGSRVESAGKMLVDKICYLTEFLGGEIDWL